MEEKNSPINDERKSNDDAELHVQYQQPASAAPHSSSTATTLTVAPPPIEHHFQPQYRHDMRPVPPYALEKLARCYYNDLGKKDDPKDDPFLKAIDGDWNDFLQTLEAKPLYLKDQIEYQKYTDGNESVSWEDLQPDLSGKWGGDERLRLTFNNGVPNISPYDNYENINEKKGRQFWRANAGSQGKGSQVGNGIQLRSKAGYWMSTEKRDDLKTTIKRILLSNPYVPLFFRIFELILSCAALGLALGIFVLSDREYDSYTVGQQPSTIMAICVQTIAVVYLLFIARDEYGGKPLGLRDPLLKLRLILLDLLFIIFSSANLSLAFNTLFDDRWVCVDSAQHEHVLVAPICRRQRGLAAFLFVMLCMWVVTFAISIFRVVEKVSSPVSPMGGHR